MSDDWLNFIASCRSGIPHNYEIVEGPMADDQVWNFVTDFLKGLITRERFWEISEFKYKTHQIVFCSQRALKCIKYLEYYEVEK